MLDHKQYIQTATCRKVTTLNTSVPRLVVCVVLTLKKCRNVGGAMQRLYGGGSNKPLATVPP